MGVFAGLKETAGASISKERTYNIDENSGRLNPSDERSTYYSDGPINKRQSNASTCTGREAGAARAEVGLGRIVLIESRSFLRDCIRRGMEVHLPNSFDAVSSVDELEGGLLHSKIRLIILSCSGSNEFGIASGVASIRRVVALVPNVPIVVLVERRDADLMCAAFKAGARGYIPTNMGFDLAVEAIRFVLAGGTYVPVEMLLSDNYKMQSPPARTQLEITAQEMRVIRAIQQGKSNKIIAYDLNMCESTVKVHVRNVMKKLGAKNRTAVAMRSREHMNGHIAAN